MLKFIFIFICEIGYLRCHICRVLTRKWKILQGSAQTIQQANNLARKTFKGNLTRRQIKSKLLKKTLIFSAPVKSTAAEGSKKLKTNTKSSKKKMINASTDDTFSFTHERLSIYIWCFMFRSIYQTKSEEKPNETAGGWSQKKKNHSYAPTHTRIGARRLTPHGKSA